MKISFNWIKDLIDEKLDLENCIDLLTDIGLEVEGVSNYSQIKTDLSQLVVGKVVECIKHPNADRLKLTTIDIGENNNLSIVCGAPNVEKNQLVVVAPVNSVLKTKDNTNFKIKKVKIRGVESCGMLCAEDEIGVGNDHSGIIVLDSKHKVGKKVSKIYDRKFLFNQSGRFKGYPFRSFAGGSFLDGYSDHLPVYILLIREL